MSSKHLHSSKVRQVVALLIVAMSVITSTASAANHPMDRAPVEYSAGTLIPPNVQPNKYFEYYYNTQMHHWVNQTQVYTGQGWKIEGSKTKDGGIVVNKVASTLSIRLSAGDFVVKAYDNYGIGQSGPPYYNGSVDTKNPVPLVANVPVALDDFGVGIYDSRYPAASPLKGGGPPK